MGAIDTSLIVTRLIIMRKNSSMRLYISSATQVEVCVQITV